MPPYICYSGDAERIQRIADLRAVKKDLEIRRDYASADQARIKSHKIGI